MTGLKMAINNIQFSLKTPAFVYDEKEYDLYLRDDELYADTGDAIIKLKEWIKMLSDNMK